MVRRYNFRIAQFSMAHAWALFALLALGIAIDAKDAPGPVTSVVNAVSQTTEPVVIKATFWQVLLCDEAKDVDV